MVVIQIKTSDQDSFLYETTCDTTNDNLVREIVRVWNLRLRLGQLVGGIREMAKYGPMKHPNKAGLDHIGETYNSETIEKGPYYQPDPTGTRTGNGVGPQLSETIEKVALDTEAALSPVGTFCVVCFLPHLNPDDVLCTGPGREEDRNHIGNATGEAGHDPWSHHYG